MAILELAFDNEQDLENWAFGNLYSFLGKTLLLKKFLIETPAGKGAVPDGIAFNFSDGKWYVLECELIGHGVWPHIAEQITRFVVALQNPHSLRRIRDRVFERVMEDDIASEIAEQLETSTDRLLQQIELFIEGVRPQVVIFIDDTTQDLEDFARALEIPTAIYRVKKFQVNNQLEFYSPDSTAPVLLTEPDDRGKASHQDIEVIEALGGGRLHPESGRRRFRAFQLNDGRIIQLKRSKYRERNDYYWYGINPSTLDKSEEIGTSHYIFVLGTWGFVTVPIETVREYCTSTKVSKNPDGTIRHYHVLISPEPEPEMYWSNESPRFDLSEFAQSFE